MAESTSGYNEKKFQEALKIACSILQVKSFYEDQEKALRKFFEGKNVFFSAHTGYGKSLIFQAIPIFADVLHDKAIGTSVVLVISPLISLMKDQVKHCNESFGISAGAIYSGQDEDMLQNIEDGVYSLVYTSPEAFLSSKRWRSIASSKSFKDECVAIVIDEGHCVVQWGRSESQKKLPFRVWYSKINELKSSLPLARYAIFTATTTKATKMTLFDMLDLTSQDTFSIEKSPARSNIGYYFIYVDKNLELAIIFKDLIEEIKQLEHKAKRTIIFCQTRKQCAVLYRLFSLALGDKLHAFASNDPRMRLVEMFHAGTPNTVKEHILSEMVRFDSHLRLIICTVAFGMGIDCKDTYRSFHFGPPKTVELLMQECGRLGRDGKQCMSYILYNGLLSSRCSTHIKQLIQTQSCRRGYILSLFTASDHDEIERNCLCCDNCAMLCQCNDSHQHVEFGKDTGEATSGSASVKTRTVSDDQRHILHQKLLKYRKTLLPKTIAEFVPVGPPNVFFEFSQFQIEQILQNCHRMFAVKDILEHVEIWRNIHANNVFVALSETFNDMNDEDIPLLTEEEFEDIEVLPGEWEIVRDDSTLNDLQASMLSDLELETSVENSLEHSTITEFNVSGILTSIASAAQINTTECS